MTRHQHVNTCFSSSVGLQRQFLCRTTTAEAAHCWRKRDGPQTALWILRNEPLSLLLYGFLVVSSITSMEYIFLRWVNLQTSGQCTCSYKPSINATNSKAEALLEGKKWTTTTLTDLRIKSLLLASAFFVIFSMLPRNLFFSAGLRLQTSGDDILTL